jgi:hypothetical protein
VFKVTTFTYAKLCRVPKSNKTTRLTIITPLVDWIPTPRYTLLLRRQPFHFAPKSKTKNCCAIGFIKQRKSTRYFTYAMETDSPPQLKVCTEIFETKSKANKINSITSTLDNHCNHSYPTSSKLEFRTDTANISATSI